MPELIGIFGGTFDPIHLGHLNAVKQLDQSLNFDRVHWVLSARPPHKNQVSASIEHRYAMLQLALSQYDRYWPDDTEITRVEKSYTVDTVDHFQQRYPQATLCLIIGADSLAKLHTWSRYTQLIEQVHIIVMQRPGYELKVPEYLSDRVLESTSQLPKQKSTKLVLFRDADFDISSSQLRSVLTQKPVTQANNKLAQQFLDTAVLDYIHKHRLYEIDSMNSDKIKQQVVAALEDVKGVDINVINIKDVSDFADYMVVASGTSDTHVKALARTAADNLREQGVKPLNVNGDDIGEWVLVDFGDVVLHVMRPEVRDYYDLEKLWDEDVRNLVKQHRDEQDA